MKIIIIITISNNTRSVVSRGMQGLYPWRAIVRAGPVNR